MFTSWIVACALALAMAITIGHGGGHRIGFDQSSFPCPEDHVLMYAPEFGPDRVGCLPLETLPD